MAPTHKKTSPYLPLLLALLLILTPLLSGCAGESLPAPAPKSAAQAGEDDVSHEEGANIIVIIEIAIGLLLVASLVGIVTQRLRFPYTVGLVLIGLALSLQKQITLHVSPELFLGLLVPPLIFEAAFHLKIKDLRKDITHILALAIPGVLLTTFLVGGVVAWGTGFPLPVALVFGALIAATDPVAVVALFRSLGVPKRIQVLLEGESLLNDGTAIVIFNLMVTIAISGQFNLLDSLLDFVVVAGGGLAVGFLLGVLISQAIKSIDEPLIETTLTSVLAFGAYLVAEQFHVSGVLAVVAAGLVSGNINPRGMSPTTRIIVFNFWDYAAFLANSFVFLLIGLQIDLRVLFTNWYVILWAILAVLGARLVGVYGTSWIARDVPKRYQPVIAWGGLRGAISLALALSLPAALGEVRGEIQAMSFGVVLFTLLVQGLSMKPLLQRLGLIKRTEAQAEYERRHARAVMARSALTHLEEIHQEGLIPTYLWEILAAPLQKHAESLSQAATELLRKAPEVELAELDNTMRELFQNQRSTLNTLLRDGVISEETYTEMVGEVDVALTERRPNIVSLLHRRGDLNVKGLMVIIVQEEDVENVVAALSRRGVPVTRLSSAGGFLGWKNTTLLVGVPEDQEELIVETIKKSSRQRVEFRPSSEGESVPRSQITIGGATIFNFDIERYQEL